MKNFITTLVCWKLLTEKDVRGIRLFLLPFLAIQILTAAIFGDLIFLAIRLQHLQVTFIRKFFLPPSLFLIFAIPIGLIYFYRKKVDIDILRQKLSILEAKDKKALKIRAFAISFLFAFSPLLSLTIFSILTKMNIL